MSETLVNESLADQPWIMIVGNPSDGYTYFGPFGSYNEVAAAGEDLASGDWWVVQLEIFEDD